MANIQDVALHAGVSTSTVSNVLNGRSGQMRRETLERVEAAIAALGYRPNRAARQLKTGHAEMLGLLVPSIANPSFAAFARAVDKAALEKHGYRVLLANTYRQKENERAFLADLFSHGIQGAVVVSAQVEQQHFRDAIDNGLILVNYDGRTKARQEPGSALIDSVSMNNYEAGRIAAGHLIERGCRRLAFATESGRTVSRLDKIDGFLSMTNEAGLAASTIIIEGKGAAAYGDSEMADLGRSLAERIARMPERPEGIVAINDMMAIGLIAGFRSCGLRVPDNISIVGIDDILFAALVNPALTSVAAPIAEIAGAIVDRLIARIHDPSIPGEEFLFTPELVCRESVAERR